MATRQDETHGTQRDRWEGLTLRGYLSNEGGVFDDIQKLSGTARCLFEGALIQHRSKGFTPDLLLDPDAMRRFASMDAATKAPLVARFPVLSVRDVTRPMSADRYFAEIDDVRKVQGERQITDWRADVSVVKTIIPKG